MGAVAVGNSLEPPCIALNCQLLLALRYLIGNGETVLSCAQYNH
jgi:hypothetical protein